MEPMWIRKVNEYDADDVTHFCDEEAGDFFADDPGTGVYELCGGPPSGVVNRQYEISVGNMFVRSCNCPQFYIEYEGDDIEYTLFINGDEEYKSLFVIPDKYLTKVQEIIDIWNSRFAVKTILTV